jgi:hypothetical protein
MKMLIVQSCNISLIVTKKIKHESKTNGIQKNVYTHANVFTLVSLSKQTVGVPSDNTANHHICREAL